MKKKILVIIAFLAFNSVKAQFTYNIDSTCFNAVSFEAGMVDAEFADINQDGHLDLLSIGDHGSPFVNSSQHGITVFFGDGSGTTWSLFQNGNFGYGGIAVGDLNNDGFQDVAYGMHHNYSSDDFGDQLLEAALGDGSGTYWTPWDDGLGQSGETYGMFGTELGDLNNDGLLDIVSSPFGTYAGLHAYINMGDGTWQQCFGFTGGNNGKYLQVGDVDHDGNLDFVNCHYGTAAYFGDGTGLLSYSHFNLPSTGSFGYNDVSLGDIDNDGADDFAFAVNRVPYVYKWNTSTAQWVNVSAGLTGTETVLTRLVDLDVDGFVDLVTVDRSVTAAPTGKLKIWKGDGGNSWTNVYTYNLPYWVLTGNELVIDDVDHNGYPDIFAVFGIQTGGPFNPSEANKRNLFLQNSPASALTISMTYPRNFECFPDSSVRFIKWVSAIPSNHSSTVKIEFSSTGNTGPWTVIAAAAPNNGTYQWTTPGVVSKNCYIRITATDNVTTATSSTMNSKQFQVGVCDLSVNIAQVKNKEELYVAPNPFHSSTTLYSSLKNCSVSIFDITGKKVFSDDKVENFPYNIESGNMAPGAYVLEVYQSNGTVNRTKLLLD